MRTVITAALALCASSAIAVEGRLQSVTPGLEAVILYQSGKSLREWEAAYEAYATGRPASTGRRMISDEAACVVEKDQRAQTDDVDRELIDVIILGGGKDGCRGIVRRESFTPQD